MRSAAVAETIAVELRDLVRQASGDVAGKTIAAQVRQAARNLGYEPESWRVREGWYRRAGRWHPAAIEDMRRRFAAWREREAAQCPADSHELARRVAEIQGALDQLHRLVAMLNVEIDNLLPAGSHANDESSATDV